MGENKTIDAPPEQTLHEKIGMMKEIDPVRLELEARIKLLEFSQKNVKAKGEDGFDEEVKAILAQQFEDGLKDAQADLAEYDPGEDAPIVMVKLMDPAMFTDFQHRHGEIVRRSGKSPSLALRRAEVKLKREIVGWGVAGHRNVTVMSQAVPYSSVVVEYEAEKHAVTHNRVVKEYERLGWLDALVSAINEFNTLSDQKKRRS